MADNTFNFDLDAPAVPTLTLDPVDAPAEEKQPEPAEAPAPEQQVRLTPEEQAMVDSFAQKIDITNSQQVLQYGSACQKKIGDFSEAALSKVSTKDLGEVGGLPRILDMGQCNDAYSAVQVALALADAFGCGVNDLPLTLVLSWYEQKAVCILLTLLSLGIKNMYLGPTMPAFLSESVVKILVETYGLQPITAPEQDLDAILGR